MYSAHSVNIVHILYTKCVIVSPDALNGMVYHVTMTTET